MQHQVASGQRAELCALTGRAVASSVAKGDGGLYGIASIRERLSHHRFEALERDDHRRAAVALALRPIRDDDCALLFIHRAEHPEDPWSGHMALPGGRVDASDPDALAAVCRETFEEVAVDLHAAGRLLGRLDDIGATARGKRVPLLITPFVFELTSPVDPTPNHEVQAVHWIALSELCSVEARSTMALTYDGQPWVLPCLHLSDRVIWGLTYQMLRSFVAAIGVDALTS